jgi:hypothetical protein
VFLFLVIMAQKICYTKCSKAPVREAEIRGGRGEAGFAGSRRIRRIERVKGAEINKCELKRNGRRAMKEFGSSMTFSSI